ncbi:hypothetical protein CSW78_27985 [Shigella flexneri]|nr:hypothetical protein CSW78_27985 [Shigella flexneri]
MPEEKVLAKGLIERIGLKDFVYPLASLQRCQCLMKFKENFKNGLKVLKYKIDFVIIVENA